MISEKYGIANGVRQGGVLSPILFGIYMNNLINRRSVLVVSTIGRGYHALRSFSADLNRPSPMNRHTYDTHLVEIKDAADLGTVESMNSAVAEICYLHATAT